MHKNKGKNCVYFKKSASAYIEDQKKFSYIKKSERED